jgi:shikimate dehydrogenase
MTDTPLITGATRTVLVIADPVEQLRTPQAQNTLWKERGLDLVTMPAKVSPEGLETFLAGLRANESAAGAVVSIPHKQTAVGFCDALGPVAAVTGAVNAIRRLADGRLVGETFDGDGFVAGLLARGVDPAGRRVRLLGAGGAASAIGVALARAGIASLRIENRTVARAELLADRIRQATDLADVTTDRRGPDDDLIVNATSQGMRPDDATDFRFEGMSELAVAADVIVSDRLTPFLAAAEQRGIAVHEGRHMLDGQMVLIADFLLGD